ncbi:retron system putative HNH endonuclease [Nannocystis bainbridge]|uniref:TIGR02646 family protein n=1 Tax=Nannocystis bainbridge TaxID=2995303 RepID=A0ABT5E063_9BACT|nr:retron system putative HNH endonuclease [Nannocystis bainbridge]MDC0719224.1 TIGR02646 family protein [Nannocystis bainbridge]
MYGDQKQSMRDALVRDQGSLCAYCQRRVKATEADMRIDHWHPRERGGGVFQWNNLVGSCADRVTCDAAKQETRLFLHPARGLGPDPRQFLRYTGSGEVVADDERARADTRTLGLNDDRLVRARRAVLDALRGWIARRERSTAELQRQIVLLESPAGEAPEYAATRAYYFRKWSRARGAAVER